MRHWLIQFLCRLMRFNPCKGCMYNQDRDDEDDALYNWSDGIPVETITTNNTNYVNQVKICKGDKKMRKWISTIIVVILLMAGGVQAKNWNISALGEGDTLLVRGGYNITEKIETGFEIILLADDVPMAYGAYGILKFDTVQVPNPIPLDFLPREISATPYAGMQVGMDFGVKGTFCGPVAGLTIGPMIIEYQYYGADFQLVSEDNRQRIVLGLKWEF